MIVNFFLFILVGYCLKIWPGDRIGISNQRIGWLGLDWAKASQGVGRTLYVSASAPKSKLGCVQDGVQGEANPGIAEPPKCDSCRKLNLVDLTSLTRPQLTPPLARRGAELIYDSVP